MPIPVPAWTATFVDTDDLHTVEFRQMFVDHVITAITLATEVNCIQHQGGPSFPRGGTYYNPASMYFSVSAIMADGETPRSTEASVTIPLDAAGTYVFGGTTFTWYKSRGVDLAWTAVPGALSYRIYRRKDVYTASDGLAQEIVRVKAGTTAWTDNGANYSLFIPQASRVPPGSPPSATAAPSGFTATVTSGASVGYTVQIGEDLQQGSRTTSMYSWAGVASMQYEIARAMHFVSDSPGGAPLYAPTGLTKEPIEIILGSWLWRRRRPRRIYDLNSTSSNTEWRGASTDPVSGLPGWSGPVMPSTYPDPTQPGGASYIEPVIGMIAEYYEVASSYYPSGIGDGMLFVFRDASFNNGQGDPPCAYRGLAQFVGPGTPIPGATYYFKVTYVTAMGESLAGIETSITCADGFVPTVSDPGPDFGGLATGWNAYVSTTSGAEQRQNASPIAIGVGATWVMPATGLIAGPAVPGADTSGGLTPPDPGPLGTLPVTPTTWALFSPADQLTHRADILDSSNAQTSHNFIRAGILDVGDYIGPWLFNQLRDAILQMNYAV